MFWEDVPRSGSEIIAARMRARTVVSGGMMLMGGRVFIALMLERLFLEPGEKKFNAKKIHSQMI